MKLLYLVPSVNNSGGVAKTIAVKSDYFIERWGYEVHIVTQNSGFQNPFFQFHPKIFWHDIPQNGKYLGAAIQYRKQIREQLRQIQPDVILVADNGLKAYLLPFLIGNNIPLVFEAHGSKYVREEPFLVPIFSKLKFALMVKVKEWGVKRFKVLVTLNAESAREWDKESIIIPNPLSLISGSKSTLQTKKVLAVTRNSHEKGIDRLLMIWKAIAQKHTDWILEVYGVLGFEKDWLPMVKHLNIENSVRFHPPTHNIANCYTEASVFVMTSRTEGMGLVLLEAMASGLPCIAYDCPIGPRSIISDGVNGFLVEDGNVQAFVQKLELLIEEVSLRKKLGENAFESVSKYDLDTIMWQWKAMLEKLIET